MSSYATPAQIIVDLALSITSIGVGYQLANLASSSPCNGETKTDSIFLVEQEELTEESNDEDSEDIPDGDLAAVSAGWIEPCKMDVLLVHTGISGSHREDGLEDESRHYSISILSDYFNIINRCANATLACYKALSKKNQNLVQHWERTGQAKIALKGKSEDQLLELQAIAKSLNLCARAAIDPALGENVRTVLAIGPAPVNLVNEVTGKLRLL